IAIGRVRLRDALAVDLARAEAGPALLRLALPAGAHRRWAVGAAGRLVVHQRLSSMGTVCGDRVGPMNSTRLGPAACRRSKVWSVTSVHRAKCGWTLPW